MIGEFSLYGLYVPWLLVLCLAALACSRALSRALAWCGLYRFVWHPALFDTAMFVLLLGGFTFFLPNGLS
jgi:hypothetical protein